MRRTRQVGSPITAAMAIAALCLCAASTSLHAGSAGGSSGADDPGAGGIESVGGGAGFFDPYDSTKYSWPAVPGVTLYEVVRGPGIHMPAPCALFTASTNHLIDTGIPEWDSLFLYFVREKEPSQGSFGYGFNLSQCHREVICDDGLDDELDGFADCADSDCDGADGCEYGAEVSCRDHFDNDRDGAADCDDTDCIPTADCQPRIFGFTDTTVDQLAPSALASFFSSLLAEPFEHISFELDTGGIPLRLCMERADFYKAEFLANSDRGTSQSGAWNKWYSSPDTGGSWIGPDTASYPNYFGEDCQLIGSWCPEQGLGGLYMAVDPANDGACETYDGVSCGDGTWLLKIKAGPIRQSVCGF